MSANLPRSLPNIIDLLLDAVFIVDAHGQIVYVSAAVERIFGYTPVEMMGMTMMDLIVPEDRERTREEAAQVMSGKHRVGFENRYIRKDGRIVHIMWSARWSEADQLRIGVARDVTEHKRAADMQAATYAISEAAYSAVDLVAMFRDIHRIIGTLVSASYFAVALPDERTGVPAFSYQMAPCGNALPEHAAALRQLYSEIFRTRQPVIRSAPLPGKGGEESWIALPLPSPNGIAGSLILKSYPGTCYGEKDMELLQFVSTQVATAIERRRLSDELQRAARYDELTGLPNRRLFHDRIKSALARTRRHGERVALLYVDIDDFKRVNDSLGHAAGDRLLQEIALRLQQSVREVDTVARLGGDEFVVLLEGLQQPGDARTVADKILSAISHPVHVDGHLLCTQSSIGVALYPDHGKSVEELLRHADMKMYKTKKAKTAGA